MSLVSANGLEAIGLVLFAVATILAVVLALRHRKNHNLPWVHLTIYASLRFVSSILSLAALSDRQVRPLIASEYFSSIAIAPFLFALRSLIQRT